MTVWTARRICDLVMRAMWRAADCCRSSNKPVRAELRTSLTEYLNAHPDRKPQCGVQLADEYLAALQESGAIREPQLSCRCVAA